MSGVSKSKKLIENGTGCYSDWAGFIKQLDIDGHKNGVEKAMTTIKSTQSIKVKQLSWVSMPKLNAYNSLKGRGMVAVMYTFTDVNLGSDGKVIMLID